uniref:Uncharacterized protein n=1 Tax=Candidatus Kentrum sp. FM TaxID=2126340 RepID=A0A450S2T7_9GAMM|nr:MAG: hypothetical protein BECKFM1743A_GA0114220_100296 [Candidatus Kentron sp. FM]VFJ45958.1 MAG: hypothetical protein BECKFM1743C_GA0114222_100326 [Candidatus Kentron sp. FM]VFK07400.1 MAG: hypothetical protein BECKFM1743B_GA0114221_100406 [Candidatus Kentron sp. FM]
MVMIGIFPLDSAMIAAQGDEPDFDSISRGLEMSY